MTLHNLDIFIAAVVLLSILTIVIHWNGTRKHPLPNLLFRIFLIANTYYLVVTALIKNEGILSVPHLFRTGNIGLFIAIPLVYLILIKSFKNESWKKIDNLHFILTILYIVDFLPFFSLPIELKLEAMGDLGKSGFTTTFGFDEGWLMGGTFWMVSKILYPFTYSILSLITLNRITVQSGLSFRKDHRHLIILLYLLSAYLIFSTIPIGLSFAGIMGLNAWENTSVIIFSTTLIIYLFILLNPEVLYGLKGIWVMTPESQAMAQKEDLYELNGSEDSFNDSAISPEKSFKISRSKAAKKVSPVTYLDLEQVENMERVLNIYMNEKQPYLKKRFSLSQMAQDTKFPLHHISAFLNQHLGENFNDYINKFRINYLISLYDQDPSVFDQFTFEYLSSKSGFGSRSAFITFFKKNTGKSPSAFFRSRHRNPNPDKN
jgi:AraC-like DNA-binding protein